MDFAVRVFALLATLALGVTTVWLSLLCRKFVKELGRAIDADITMGTAFDSMAKAYGSQQKTLHNLTLIVTGLTRSRSN